MENLNFVVLDTDILIGLLRGKEDIVQLVKSLEDNNAIFLTTAINEFELYFGAYKSKFKDANIKAVHNLLQKLEVVPFVHPATEIAGRIYSELSKKGQPLEIRDLFIASITLSVNAILVTHNKKHFTRITGLKIYSEENGL